MGGGGPITILRVFRENGVKTFFFPGSTSVYLGGVGRARAFAGCLAWAFTIGAEHCDRPCNLDFRVDFQECASKSYQARKAKLAFYTSRVSDFNICPFPDG